MKITEDHVEAMLAAYHSEAGLNLTSRQAMRQALRDVFGCAELGQEVGAVGYDDGTGRVRDWASPAHTSEARDAARYRWLAENAIIQWPGVTHIGDDPASTRLPLDNAIDAAMRQEGGSDA